MINERYTELAVLVHETNYKLSTLSNLAIDIINSGRGNIPEHIYDIVMYFGLVEEPGFEKTEEEIIQLLEKLKNSIDEL